MIAWIEQYGQIVGFFIQLIFYIVVAVSALWAAFTFASYVRFMTTEEEPEAGAQSAEDAAKDEGTSVDEFVE